MKLPVFSSPKAGHCTCLPKYNLNTYLGRCAHGCIYCYAVKFPSFIGPTSPRIKLLDQIESMVRNTQRRLPVMMSDCTDPYQLLEEEYKITRRCAQVLAKNGFPLLIATKSDLVSRDLDIFEQTPTVVSMTVTTLREDVAAFIEPSAPSPDRRVSALTKVADRDIPAVARIDPIIPSVNDDEKDLEKLVSVLADAGVKQVTMATLKPVRGFLSGLKNTNPDFHQRFYRLYADGKRVLGYKYLPVERRKEILEKLRSIVLKHGLFFASCREGFPEFNTALCDGTSHCRNLLNAYLG